ncbi:SRPBCC family protein [Nocardia tenerifensis]|nr:SRPBCC family protein [Nocardia tenerifensis]
MNSIIIDAPTELVWSIANDLALWPRLFADEYESVRVLEAVPDRARFEVTTHPRDGKQYTWISERSMDHERLVATARRITLGPFRYMHIAHWITSDDAVSRLTWVQDFEMRADAPVTDTQMKAHIDRSSTANLLRHKEFIEAKVGAR